LSLWEYADALRETDSLQVRLALLLYADYLRQNGEGGPGKS